MPIYEYQCQACEHDLEVLQKISDQPLQECPSCGEPALRKKVSAAAFRLKGGGWYETDFKTGDKKNIAGDTSTTESGAKDSGKDGATPGGKKEADSGSTAGGDSAGKSAASGTSSGDSGSSTATA